MAGIDGFGIELEIGDGSGGFDTVGEVTNVNPLDVSADDLDVSSHDSPDQYREFIGGLRDGGEVEAEIRWDPTVHGDFLDAVGVTRAFRITFPAAADSAVVTFNGHINGYEVDAPHDDALEGSISIKVSGKPTLA